MADQAINPVQIPVNSISEFGGWNAINASNDGLLTVPADGRYLLVLQDTAGGSTIRIRHGDGVEGAQGDIVLSNMKQNVLYFSHAESARAKRVWGSGTPGIEGADRGKIRLSSSASVNVACIEMV